MALCCQLLAVTNRIAESWRLFLENLDGSFWPTFGCNKSYCRVLVALSGQVLAVTNRTAESWWLFLAHIWPQQIVLPSLGGSLWPTLDRNKSYCRVLVALSGPRLAVTNRTAESRWLFLAHSWPLQIVLPSLNAFFWLTFGRNKSYYRFSVALSCQLLAVSNRIAESWRLFLANSWLFLATFACNKKRCRISLALSGQFLAVTNRIGCFWPAPGHNKSYCRVLVALSDPYLVVINRIAIS